MHRPLPDVRAGDYVRRRMPCTGAAADIWVVTPPSRPYPPMMPTSNTCRPSALRPFLSCIAAFSARLAVVLSLGMAAVVPGAEAQQTPPAVVVSDTVMEIRLVDGSILYGRIVAADGERITIATESGARTEVSRSQIASVRASTSRLVNGERWTEDPNATRLFFGPTGRAIGRGTGYFAVYELLMPFLSYGITDRISISGGTPVIPGLIGELMYVAPKVTVVSRPGVDLAAGVLAFYVPEEDVSLGLFYGVSTFGSSDKALTVGVGLPFITGGEDFVDRIVVMLGGEARMSQRTKFITENYFVPGESGALVSGGVRFFGERLSADAGLGLAVGPDGGGCCLPIVNFVYSFGRPR